MYKMEKLSISESKETTETHTNNRSNSRKHKISEKQAEMRKEEQIRISANSEKIIQVKTQSKLDLKDYQFLKALEKNEMNVERAVLFLTEKQVQKLERSEKLKEKKQQFFKELFPLETGFNQDLFKTKKDELKAERRLIREEKFKKEFPNETEFDWKKMRTLKRAKRAEKLYSKSKNPEISGQENENQKKFKKFKNEKKKLFPKKNNKNFKGSEKIYLTEKESETEKAKRLLNLTNLLDSHKITKLYLDGNNMLFVDNLIRKDCLTKKTLDAELKLSNLSLSYIKKALVPDCTLIFDRTKQVFSKTSEGVSLLVRSAYPEFESSDDAFKIWAGCLNADELKSVLFVTSDRELTDRLKERKVENVMRSGEFMKLVKQVLGEKEYGKCLVS
jgi:hypothetical protein